MYLHGLHAPYIYEYDTLTSEDNWNEYADVILANPPFMSPKGGIRPHKRFSITSNRSEVLFVDYIAEHLTPNGRAAVIVPEGIIFQSGIAYKNLRKVLVENYLIGVISLPAGVFNPYSGVKTSILWLDRTLAKKTDKILFVKVENDGFDLGAQRKPIKQNDLPNAIKEIFSFKTKLNESDILIIENLKFCFLIAKEKILGKDDYSFSGERYREIKNFNSKFPILNLSETAEIIAGQSPEGKYYNEEGVGMPFYQGKTEFGNIYISNPTKWTTQVTKEAMKDDILMSVRAPVGPVNITRENICIGRGLAAIRANDNAVPMYLFYLLRSIQDKLIGTGGSVFDNISKKQIEEIRIPLPPISIQEEIVSEIESYQKIIDGARQVVENYKPRIEIDPKWPMVELGEILSLEYGKPLKSEHRIESNVPVYGSNGIVGWHNESYVKGPGIIVGRKGTAGAINFSDVDFFPIDTTFFVELKNKTITNLKFIYYSLLNLQLDKINVQAGVPGLNRNDAYKVKIYLPNISTQLQLVDKIEKEEGIINDNNRLIEIFEQKIKDRIAKVWGE
jgi:type I restriction enzyme M protein